MLWWLMVAFLLFAKCCRCSCGQLVNQHVAIPPGFTNKSADEVQGVQNEPSQEKWSAVKHTQAMPTDAYGIIEFQGGGHVNKAMVFFRQPCDSLVFHRKMCSHTLGIILEIVLM